jgi:general L-amino acid transport system permease protein
MAVRFGSGQVVLAPAASRVAQARTTLEGLQTLVLARLPVVRLAPADLARLDPALLSEAALRVCVVTGPAEPNLAAQLRARHIPFAIRRYARADQAVEAYSAGECDVAAADGAALAASLGLLDDPASHRLAPLPEYPVVPSVPALEGLNLAGGARLTPEFSALLLCLVFYTGAFIAEIIRAGILSVAPGQSEAARALGLSEAQRLRLVVLPQALRAIIPPITSQYVNLAKSSSLGAPAWPSPSAFPTWWLSPTSSSISRAGRCRCWCW